MEQEEFKANYQLVSGVLEVDTPTLEAIRAAVIKFLKSPDEAFEQAYAEFREQLLTELENADCIVGNDGSARIDNWILERNTDATGVVLVRHPPRTAIMYMFFADLVQNNSGAWAVTTFGHRRVSALR